MNIMPKCPFKILKDLDVRDLKIDVSVWKQTGEPMLSIIDRTSEDYVTFTFETLEDANAAFNALAKAKIFNDLDPELE
jgi:hypothetical protein